MVDQIEETYWDLAFAERQVVIVENALEVAQEQLDSTNAIIKVGRIAPMEQAAAEAEVALRRENLIDAKSQLKETTRIQNFSSSSRPPASPSGIAPSSLHTLPFVPAGKNGPRPEKHVDVATPDAAPKSTKPNSRFSTATCRSSKPKTACSPA